LAPIFSSSIILSKTLLMLAASGAFIVIFIYLILSQS
jgi:hypothetical protein